MTEVQQKIVDCVEAYKLAFPLDYEGVKDYVKELNKRTQNVFNPTGDLTKYAGTDILERPLFELSTLLMRIFHRRLTDTELNWLFGRDAEGKPEQNYGGLHWFARTFPEFKRVEKI